MQIDENIIVKINEAKIDEIKMDAFINEYRPFILKVLSANTGKYIDVSNDSALTVGMMAFKEAVEKYDMDKGTFIGFATLLIKRRHIDYLRKENKHIEKNEMLDSESKIIKDQSSVLHNQQLEILDRKSEIEDYKKLLSKYNIEFKDLVQQSPKKKLLRILYKDIAIYLASEDELKRKVLEKRMLPIKEILMKFDVNRKKVERGRIYIMAIVLLESTELNILKEYIGRGD